jgi:hypothetical protein
MPCAACRWSFAADVATRQYVDKYHNIVNHKDLPAFPEIDGFLRQNPCWVPLYEPSRHRLHHTVPVTTQLVDFSTARDAALQLHRVVVLGRLPSMGFQATCMLYENITAIQFPSGLCRYDPTAMMRLELSNIGYGHTARTMIHSLIYSNFGIKDNPRVLVAPSAEWFLGRHVSLWDPLRGEDKGTNTGWGWADPVTCNEGTYKHDPWACNFIPISTFSLLCSTCLCDLL